MNSIPKYVLINSKSYTSRKFKALKRKQLKAVKKALMAYQLGSFYSPSHDEFCEINRLLDKAIEKQNAKNWGR